MTDPTRLQFTLYDSLIAIEHQEERKEFLNYIGKNDPEMRHCLERLLAVEQEAVVFFDIQASISSADGEPGDALLTEGEFVADEVGTRIGRYQLLARIGEGGCGVVYLAEQQEPVKRKVALKIIRLGMDTERVIARFEIERQSLAMMDHPNIARVYDVGATRSGRPFFVMQLVDGEKITDYCDAKRLGIAQRLSLFLRVCQAIQHAHQKGIIHLDIKPSNILVWENDGEAVPKVIDFGIARTTTPVGDGENATLTANGHFVGTPAYMSPEQASGKVQDVDTRSDIFSLGSLLYELLAGRPPSAAALLRQSGADEIRRIILETDPDEPSAAVSMLSASELAETAARRGCDPRKLAGMLKGDLDRIVLKALEKHRKRRYASADAFAADVNRYLNCEPVYARPSGRLYRLGKLIHRNKVVFAAGTLATLSLILGLGTATWMVFAERKARDSAESARANEARLREKAEMGTRIAQAAVQLKYGHLEQADALIAGIPFAQAQPSLESAATFQTLAYWHAKEGRWPEAADRMAALAYSIAGVDETDTDKVSINLLPAVAAMYQAGNQRGFDDLRTMAIARFGDTKSSVVAEQVLKVCLIVPADQKMMESLQPLADVLARAEDSSQNDSSLALWRSFSMALLEYRRKDFNSALRWCEECVDSRLNPARDALALTLRAMIFYRQGRVDEARRDMEIARRACDDRFASKLGIFEADGTIWHDWVNLRILLIETEQLLGK